MRHVHCEYVMRDKLETFMTLVLTEKTDFDMYQNPFLWMKILKLELSRALNPVLLHEIKQSGYPGVVLFENLPVDSWTQNIENPVERVQTKTRLSEAIILATAALLNCYLLSRASEQNGVIFHNVSPVKEKEHVISSVGRDPFYYHTEIAYTSAVPKFLMLYCLESDPAAKTSYIWIQDILNKIPVDYHPLLRQPIFKLSAITGYDVEFFVGPLLSIDPETGIEYFRFYQDIERLEPCPRNEVESRQLNDFLTFLKSNADRIFPQSGEEPSIGLNSGQALLLNNGFSMNGEHHGVMHGRVGRIENPFRWLQRGYFFEMTLAMRQEESQGYAAFLIKMFKHHKKYSFKLCVACLKTAIEYSHDYQRYQREHPEKTKSQLFFYGVQPHQDTMMRHQSWLNRIAEETTIPALTSLL